MNTPLKPCPFCGNKAELDRHRGYFNRKGQYRDSCAICCTKCSADMLFCYEDDPDMTEDDAEQFLTDQWNKRSSDDFVSAIQDKLHDASNFFTCQPTATHKWLHSLPISTDPRASVDQQQNRASNTMNEKPQIIEPPTLNLLQIQWLEKIFSYHPPTVEQISRYQDIRSKALECAKLIFATCPDSRERSLALTNLEQSVMWANAAIARNE